MGSRTLESKFESALSSIDIRLNGDRPWDLFVHDKRLPARIARGGMIALGDAYVDRWWDCDAPDQFFDRCLRGDLPAKMRFTRPAIIAYLSETLLNMQSKPRASRNASAHYNLGADLFKATLDKRMTYSCAFWSGSSTLDEAQEAKLDMVCRKLAIEPGMRILDIGCGWGSFAGFAAERYGCEVVGVTVSSDQVQFATERCKGLPVEIRLQDYRELDERFDRVVSIGMFEHVGQRNYRTYMRTVDRCLDADGLCLLHFFATQRSWPNLRDSETLWATRRIFPWLVVPSLKQIGAAIDGLFTLEDLHNFGADYDPTLMAWHENFNRNWPNISERYGDRFKRMWSYYLLTCAGAFRSRKYQVWQLLLSKQGVPGGCPWARWSAPASSMRAPIEEESTPPAVITKAPAPRQPSATPGV